MPRSRVSHDLRHLLTSLDGLVRRLTCEPTHPQTMRLFTLVLYIWLACYFLLLLPAAPHFWSPHAYVVPARPNPSVFQIFNLLDLPTVGAYWPAFLVSLFLAVGLGLIGWWPRTTALAIFVLTKNLDSKAWSILNGGNNLIELMLLYNLFIQPTTSNQNLTISAAVNNSLTNVAFYAARFQLVLVYTVAGLAKLQGRLWPHGVALYYVLHTDEYSHPWARRLIEESDLLIGLGSYAPVAFMLAFPWLIWNRKTRVGLLLFGTFFHLGIAFIMGLVDFATAMIACYTVWFTDRWSGMLLATLWPQTVKNK